MQYRDVYKINPGSFEWRYLSPGNFCYDEESSPEHFKSNYKTPYRHGPHFLRKLRPSNPGNQIIFNELLKKDQENLDQLFEELPGLKDTIYRGSDTIIIKRDVATEENDIEKLLQEKIEGFVGSLIAADAFRQMHKEVNFLNESNNNLDEQYVKQAITIGMDTNLDAQEGDPAWMQIYFDNLQHLWNVDQKLRDENDYKLPVYVGRTKKWQVIGDRFGKDQVDKLQVSIGAPVQEQLDLWEEENTGKFIQMPICNANQEKFRDVPDHYMKLDHDYEQILFERKRNQAFEKLRNSRHWKIDFSHHEPSEEQHHH